MAELTDSAGILAEKIPLLSCSSCEVELDISENEVFQAFSCPNCGQVMDTPGGFGDFILLRKLGAGGMGAVFLAEDLKLGRQVALKINRKEFGDNPKFLERFKTEAKAMARFNHPNVVQIYTYGTEFGQPFMVTEFVTGGDLASQMVPGEGLDQVAVLHVARDLAEGLQAAQDNGLIHGDIKPENVMFDERGNAKIMDFGLAKFGGGEEGKPKEVWGTPFYIAPEKAKKQGEDYLSDQYSLGAALYHVLAGHPPFDGKTPTDVVVARLNADAPPLHEVSPYISKKTSDIIARMMNRNPAFRYPTYASMQTDLRNAITFAEQNQGPYDAEASTNHGDVASGPGSKKFPLIPVLIGAGAVGLMALIGIIAAVVGGEQEPPPPKAPMVVTPKTAGPNPNKGPQTIPPQGGAANVDPSTFISSTKTTDDIPFSTSQQRKFETVRQLLAKNEVKNAQTLMFQINNDSRYDKIGNQWILLMRGMLDSYSGSGTEANKKYASVIAAKPVYSNGTPPVANPVDFANFMTGKLSEAAFQSKVAKYPKPFQQLAIFATSLRLADVDPQKAAARAGSYASATPATGHSAWIHSLQPLARRMSDNGIRLDKAVKALDPKTKGANHGKVQGWAKNADFKVFSGFLSKELKKWPKGK